MNLTFSGKFDNTIIIEEEFRAPIDKLYHVWTQADQLKNWFMAEEGFVVTSVAVDLKVEGNYRLGVTAQPDTPEMEISGIFQKITPSEYLAYTWNVAVLEGKKTLVTVEFHTNGTGTKILLTHGEFDNKKQTQLHAQGWIGCIAHLQKYLQSSLH